MPYYHERCGGEIVFWKRKCSKCGHTWPLSALFETNVPKGMTKFVPKVANVKVPTITPQDIARKLPKWPRWLRIASSIAIIGISLLIIMCIYRACTGSW
jgi:hypothetical protein